MRQKQENTLTYRYFFSIGVLFFYLLPILFYTFYSLISVQANIAWKICVFGLLTGGFGSFSLIYISKRWESSIRKRASILVEKKFQKLFPQKTPQKTTVLIYDAPELESSIEPQAPLSIQENEKTLTSSIPDPLIEQNKKLQKNLETLKSALNKKQESIENLFKNLEIKEQEIRKWQHKGKELSIQIEKNKEESQNFHSEHENQIEKKDSLLSEYQQTITEQRGIIEKKHKAICQLENKIRNLNYEVKTLLQLGTFNSPTRETCEEIALNPGHPLIKVFDSMEYKASENDPISQPMAVASNKEIHTPYDAAVQLQKCIEVAQNLKGINHLGGKSSRFSKISLDHYTIDLRRLFDSFRNENSCNIIVYSQAKNRLLFANNHVKNILGWSPEKFVKDFNSLIQKGKAEWEEALEQLQYAKESQTRLLIQARSGEDILIHCHLGEISQGVFKNHIIGILFPI